MLILYLFITRIMKITSVLITPRRRDRTHWFVDFMALLIVNTFIADDEERRVSIDRGSLSQYRPHLKKL